MLDGLPAELRGQGPRALGSPIPQADFMRAGLAQRIEDRPRRSARSENERAAARRRLGQRRQETWRVGVLGRDRAVLTERERVGRADLPRALARLVGELERGLL